MPSASAYSAPRTGYHGVMERTISRMVIVALATIVGGIFGVGCLGDFLLTGIRGYDHGGEGAEYAMLGGVIGAMAGAVVALFLLDRAPPNPPPENPISD